jgi:dihydrofolate reductase
MSKNRVIGSNGAIPWHLPEELKRFRRLTTGHHIIMGRKTWESIRRLLPGRETIIITRQQGYQVPGAVTVHSLDEAIAACGNDSEIFVIGGAEIYAQALPRAARLHITTVDAEIAGDAHMPEFDDGSWREVSSVSYPADERHRYSFCSATYERAD